MRKNPQPALYFCWRNMMQRCYDSANPEFKNYGARGIKVCERWHKYSNFAEDMPLRPSKTHSIDRFPNNDGNYEPGNVRWATKREQVENSRKVRVIEFAGERMSITRWAEKLGLTPSAISHRIRKYGVVQAISMGGKRP